MKRRGVLMLCISLSLRVRVVWDGFDIFGGRHVRSQLEATPNSHPAS